MSAAGAVRVPARRVDGGDRVAAAGGAGELGGFELHFARMQSQIGTAVISQLLVLQREGWGQLLGLARGVPGMNRFPRLAVRSLGPAAAHLPSVRHSQRQRAPAVIGWLVHPSPGAVRGDG